MLSVPERFKEIFKAWECCGGTLTYAKHNKQFWVRLVFETETPSAKTKGKVLGIDRGLYHMAVTSEGQCFSSRQVRAAQRRFLHNYPYRAGGTGNRQSAGCDNPCGLVISPIPL